MDIDTEVRNEEMISLRRLGYSYQAISDRMNIGLERERIRQIVTARAPELAKVKTGKGARREHWKKAVILLRKGERVELIVRGPIEATDLATRMFKAKLSKEALLNLIVRFEKL